MQVAYLLQFCGRETPQIENYVGSVTCTTLSQIWGFVRQKRKALEYRVFLTEIHITRIIIILLLTWMNNISFYCQSRKTYFSIRFWLCLYGRLYLLYFEVSQDFKQSSALILIFFKIFLYLSISYHFILQFRQFFHQI